MPLSTRPIRVSLEQQAASARVLKFYPALVGADGETLLETEYRFTVNADGTVDDTEESLIYLPTKATGTITYFYKFPKITSSGQVDSTVGKFHLSAGAEIDLADLIAAGGEASDSTIDYVDSHAVLKTGNQTVAGVKTFTSDPIIPDEAYDATAWNGSLEPPTKNAVRDKFESLVAGGATGPAGGVLSGTYPNPGFAVNMVEQSELDSQVASLQSNIDGKQPLDADLTSIAALDSSTSGAIASDGAGWVKKTYAQLKTALGLVKADVGLGNVVNLDTSTTANITDSADKRFVTDAQKTVIQNTSGANTGDQDLSGLVPTTRTVNGHALSANVTVTKSDVGLGSVDNTSDASKPVSTATQTALDLKANLASPTFTGTVSGITKSMVGLGNVDNTSDASKPVSTATQTALDLKADKTPTVNAQTGTTYTLQASDNGKVVTLSNASGITLTVPSGLGAGFNCLLVQLGAGQVTLSPSSTTLNNRQGHTKLAGQYATASLVAYVANTFAFGGDTAS